MGFSLKLPPTFKAKAAIGIPGAVAPSLVEFEFKAFTRDEYFAWLDRVRAAKTADDQALPEIVVGWTDVDAAFSPEALAQLLNTYPSAAEAILEAFRKELFEARRKN